jgi:predicted membrane protein
MENGFKTRRHNRPRNGFSFAFILIAAGFILLGINTGWIPSEYKSVFISWQMLLIVLGVGKLLKGHFTAGTLLMVIGGFFLVPVLNKIDASWIGTVPADFVHLYWPVLLIVAGAFIFLGWLFPKSGLFCCHRERHHRFGQRVDNSIDSGYVESNNIFGSGEHIVLDSEFKGGEINSVFGGTKLDLRKTSLREGTTTLEVNVVFGGVEIFIPSNWNVVIRMDSILGGFVDKRYGGSEEVDSTRTLVINGSCVFGGGELKN